MSDALIQGFSHILLPVPDVQQTMNFYCEHLGFSLLRRYRLGEMESGYLTLGGVLLEVVPLHNGDARPERLDNPIGLAVSDLDAVLTDLRSHGIECGDANDARTFWGRQAKIRDNSGYLVSLRQYNEPDGPNFAGWQPRHNNVTRLA